MLPGSYVLKKATKGDLIEFQRIGYCVISFIFPIKKLQCKFQHWAVFVGFEDGTAYVINLNGEPSRKAEASV